MWAALDSWMQVDVSEGNSKGGTFTKDHLADLSRLLGLVYIASWRPWDILIQRCILLQIHDGYVFLSLIYWCLQ